MAARFQARLTVAGRQIYLGRWPSERAAALACDRAALKLKLLRPLRYAEEARMLGAAAPAELMAEARALEKKSTTSRFLGVSWDARTKSWRVSLRSPDKSYSITGFADEQAAALVRDRLALHVLGRAAPLNFPLRRLKASSYEQLQREQRELRGTSRYRGVTYDASVQRFCWVAQLKVDYSSVFLGRYATEREAAIAYDRAAMYYLGELATLNLPRITRKLEPTSADQLRQGVRSEFKKLTKSSFRGVAPSDQNWSARIRHRNRQYFLGTFPSEESAAEAYDKAARRLHGKQAKLNFPT